MDYNSQLLYRLELPEVRLLAERHLAVSLSYSVPRSNSTNDPLPVDDVDDDDDDDDVEWDDSLETPYDDWISTDVVTEELVLLSLAAPQYEDGHD